MSRTFTVEKEAEYRWNVLGWDGSKVQGPYKFKREAAAVAEEYNRILKDPDAGGALHSGNAANFTNKPKNTALPSAPGYGQTKKATVAAAPTSEPAPPQLQCACGWIVIPEVAYKHFEECPSFRKL